MSARTRSSGCSAPAAWARSTARATCSTSAVVALKVLREDQLEQERAVDRMMREASILATVPHGGIPRFYECGLLARRPAVDRDGARAGHAARGAPPRGAAPAAEVHGPRRRRRRRARGRARARRHASRSQARQHPARADRSGLSAARDRLGHRASLRRRALHEHERGDRHSDVHGARAGARRADRRPLRRLRPRHRRVPGAHRARRRSSATRRSRSSCSTSTDRSPRSLRAAPTRRSGSSSSSSACSIKSFEERPSAADVTRRASSRLRDDRRPAYEAGDETGPVPREELDARADRADAPPAAAPSSTRES